MELLMWGFALVMLVAYLVARMGEIDGH